MPGPFQISAAQLARLIGLPESPFLIDVRLAEDFAAAPRLIPGSCRMAYDQLTLPQGLAPSARVVVICQRGKKLSEGAAALLRLRGLAAESLEGGFDAWESAGQPTLPAALIPARHLWVTRQRPKIDRIACPWLIRRFMDREAQFLFVAAAEVLSVAERFGAEPFDVDGARFSHRADLCSFDALLDDFGLRTPALDRLSKVVRGADTDRHDLAPQAAGLLALSVGLSRQYRDDLAQLEAGLTLYDALYRWARDGFDEGHDWPAAPGGDAR